MNGDFFTGYAQRDVLAAASTGSREAAFSGMFWLFGIVAVSTLAAIVVGYFRHQMRSAEPLPGLGLTLEELREQHERGNLTVDEFETLKEKLVIDVGIKPSPTSRASDKVLHRVRRS